MIIPVRCVTCNKVLADKWAYYQNECSKLESKGKKVMELSDLEQLFKKDKQMGNFDSVLRKDLLDKLGLTRICCRRHMLGHVELIDDI
jgi:DNA-directed RNA polymerase subunit N (RpoN/RPB10)